MAVLLKTRIAVEILRALNIVLTHLGMFLNSSALIRAIWNFLTVLYARVPDMAVVLSGYQRKNTNANKVKRGVCKVDVCVA